MLAIHKSKNSNPNLIFPFVEIKAVIFVWKILDGAVLFVPPDCLGKVQIDSLLFWNGYFLNEEMILDHGWSKSGLKSRISMLWHELWNKSALKLLFLTILKKRQKYFLQIFAKIPNVQIKFFKNHQNILIYLIIFKLNNFFYFEIQNLF